jgi:hypothetical protein
MIKKIFLISLFLLLASCGDFHYTGKNGKWIVIQVKESKLYGNSYEIREIHTDSTKYNDFWIRTDQQFDLGGELLVIKKEK